MGPDRRPDYLRLTKFFGKLFLINFAIGVVTGIVQEFQFGMNWSDYSRFVGDVFGAPLAIEGLLAFFLESTFLGLWIFGWDRLAPTAARACIWIVHVGTLLSAYFILAANSWMQHPVGYAFNPDDRSGRARPTSWAVLTNSTQLVTFPHTVLAAYLTGGAFVARGRAVAARPPLDRRRRPADVRHGNPDRRLGDGGGRDRRRRHRRRPGQDHDRPAADEDGGGRGALRHRAARVVLHLHDRIPGRLRGEVRDQDPRPAVVPGHGQASTARSRASTSSATQYEETYGQDPGATYYTAGDYVPIIPVTYWAFRLMIGLGMLAALVAAPCCSGDARGRRAARAGVGLGGHRPAAAAGRRELVRLDLHRDGPAAMGRLRPDDDRARGLARRQRRPRRWISLSSLTLLYAVLMVVEIGLMLRCDPRRRRSVRGTTRPDADSRRRPTPRLRVLRGTAMELTTVWFCLIAVLWVGYFILEGFDFGVGMLLPVLARDETERRVLINTIGPVWDGNEVWVLVAGGATFAAFPEWYATLFSGFYLPLLLILVALIVRGVAFEYRAQASTTRPGAPLGPAIFVGSFVPAAAVGRGLRQHRPRCRHRRRQGVRRQRLRPAQPLRTARRLTTLGCSSPTVRCSSR